MDFLGIAFGRNFLRPRGTGFAIGSELDLDQFVMIQEGERWGTRLELVNNWFEELKEKVPTGR